MTARNTVPALLILGALAASGCARPEPGTYKDPAEAIPAMSAILGQGDAAAFDKVFGPGSAEVLASGDTVADKADGEKVKALLAEKAVVEDLDETTKILVLGNDGWPFPIPLVKDGEIWRFDVAAGKEEVLNRRVGRNELRTIATLHAIVDAQREYVAEGRDGLPPAYASRLISTDGTHDGLYWPPVEDEPLSPLGDGVAAAAAEGYVVDQAPSPFHGYQYKLLTAQGPSAPGGEKSYLDEAGLLSKGFACMAWPTKHGSSGVMTFLVSDRGLVFQKDLGADTATLAAAMTTFDPDATWEPTWDPDAEATQALAD